MYNSLMDLQVEAAFGCVLQPDYIEEMFHHILVNVILVKCEIYNSVIANMIAPVATFSKHLSTTFARKYSDINLDMKT